jgi:hypothetical protein
MLKLAGSFAVVGHSRQPVLRALLLYRDRGAGQRTVRALTCASGCRSCALPVAARRVPVRAHSRLQPVDEDEQQQPDHIHEVPVPGHRLEGEMALGA